MISRRTLSRLAVLGCLGLTFVLAPGAAKPAGAAFCPKGTCHTSADCTPAHCASYGSLPMQGICGAGCCFCYD